MDLPKQFKFEDDPFSRHKKAEGIPLDKILFSTSVYDPQSAGRDAAKLIAAAKAYTKKAKKPAPLIGQSIPEIIKQATDAPQNVDLGSALSLMKIAKLVLEVDFLKKRFILGKALSFSRPGESFDIVLSGCPSM